MNIVVLVSGGLTETLQTAPLLRNLRHGMPDAHILLAGPLRAAVVAPELLAIDEYLPLRALDHEGGGINSGWPSAWAALRGRRLDIGVMCSRRHRDAALLYAAAIPCRVGTSAQRGLSLMLTDHRRPWVASHADGDHAATNNAAEWAGLAVLLDLAPVDGHADIRVDAQAERRVESLLSAAGIDLDRLTVALAPGTAESDAPGIPAGALRWSPERFAHLGNQLGLRHGAAIAMIGSEADRAAVNAACVDLAADHIDLCGELDPAETTALLSRCDLVVAGDSPVLHLAAAVGTAAIGLFGPTDGHRRGPYGDRQGSVQALAIPAARSGPYGPATLERIRVEDVLAGIESTS